LFHPGEGHAMTTPVASTAPPARDTNPYTYGWRYVTRRGANGEVTLDEVPLTLEDVLHPLEGDVIPENSLHGIERDYIRRACQSRLRGVAGVLVLADCLIDWDHPIIRPISPDVSVIFDVADPGLPRGMFYTAREGTRPSLVLEIVSSHTRANDITKIDLYYQLGIPEYVMIDRQREDGPRSLIHRRWEPTGWVVTEGDENGVLLQAANVRLRLRDNRAVCFDATTGEEILDYGELEEARDQLQEANTELQEERDELREERDELQKARDDAEREARDQARAREDAERRILDLEAELKRLRGEPPA
jgi:hypothetical protein